MHLVINIIQDNLVNIEKNSDSQWHYSYHLLSHSTPTNQWNRRSIASKCCQEVGLIISSPPVKECGICPGETSFQHFSLLLTLGCRTYIPSDFNWEGRNHLFYLSLIHKGTLYSRNSKPRICGTWLPSAQYTYRAEVPHLEKQSKKTRNYYPHPHPAYQVELSVWE